MQEFIDSELFKWVILPLLIFLARMCDVTLGTLRNVFISKGLRRVVPVMAFFEVLIWLISIRQIMKYLNNPMCYVGFAGGYSMGTYVGMFVERKLSLGIMVIRIITDKEPVELIKKLRECNIGCTIIDGQGARGPVKILLMVVNRTDMDMVINNIKTLTPAAFYSIEDTRTARQGVFPNQSQSARAMDYVRRTFSSSPQK